MLSKYGVKEKASKENLNKFAYYLNEKTGISFEKRYIIYGDGEWVVMVGEDGLIETAFSPDSNNGYYMGYLKNLNAL